jgi:hypothetical protein
MALVGTDGRLPKIDVSIFFHPPVASSSQNLKQQTSGLVWYFVGLQKMQLGKL